MATPLGILKLEFIKVWCRPSNHGMCENALGWILDNACTPGWRQAQQGRPKINRGACCLVRSTPVLYFEAKLWIEKTNDLVDIETDISRNLKGLVAIEIATAVSLAGVETAIWIFETQPRRERELDR
jgi:hypothetical protein